MRDLTDPRWLYAKAALLLVGGVLASAVLLIETPAWRAALLLAVTVWCFCRAYDFAFYVTGKYVDSSFRFAGLTSVVRYWLRRKP